MSDLERAARALFDIDHKWLNRGFKQASKDIQTGYMMRAIACLSAIREPSGAAIPHGWNKHSTQVRFAAVIDAILANKTGVTIGDLRVERVEADLRQWQACAEAAENEPNSRTEQEEEKEHQDFRLENDREWKAKVDHQKARAEAAEKRVERLEAGLQVLSTTFYKGDQHQDYAKHVLAAPSDFMSVPAADVVLSLKARAEAAEAALRKIAEFTSPLHEAGAIARAALEAKP